VADDWCCKGTDPSCDGPQECANRAALLIEAQHAEIKRLRVALAYACGILSTYYDETTHPEELMHRFIEEARRG
jgi:hypothetical protein